jgi:hypothetical protein
MAEIIRDDRKVIRQGKDFLFKLNQEQIYTSEQRNNLLIDWRKELAQKEEWINNYDAMLEEAIKETNKFLENSKKKVAEDIENLKEGIRIWEDVKNE